MKKKLFLVFALTALCLVMLAGCGTKTVKLADYVNYKLKGYDGFGELTDKYDDDALAEAIAEAAGFNPKKSNYDDKLDQIEEDLEDLLEGEWSATDHIAVGDELTYTFDIGAESLKKKYKVVFDTADYTHTVEASELKALQELNANEILEINLYGYSGAGEAYGAYISKEDLYDIEATLPEGLGETLSNGDVLDITLSLNGKQDLKEYLGKLGYKAPENNILKYTVEGLEEPQVVDPFDYLTISFEGFNGFAKAKYEWADNTPKGVSYLDPTTDKAENLSNGDEVKITLTYWYDDPVKQLLSTYGVKLTTLEKTFTVADLTETTAIDLFDYVTVTFEGVSGRAKATYAVDPESEYAEILDELYLRFDTSYNLSLGDKVTLTATRYGDDPTDYLAENYGLLIASAQKEYTADPLDYYITDTKDFSESGVQNLADLCIEDYTANVAAKWGASSLTDMEYVGKYLLYRKDMSISYNVNYLYMIFKVSGTHEKSGDFTIYVYYRFRDIIHKVEGGIPIDTSDYTSGYHSVYPFEKTYTWYYGYASLEEMYEDVVTRNAGDYDAEVDMPE